MANMHLKSRPITFENGNTAHYIIVPQNTPVEVILDSLKIKKPLAVLTVIGGAKALDVPKTNKLTALFSRGVARAAVKRGTLIVTGGTDIGVMHMIGQGIADRGRSAPCIGIAPADLVQYLDEAQPSKTKNYTALEPNHSHFVLVEGDEWGDETETMYRLVRYLSEGVTAALTILANGGRVAKEELLYCVRQNRPILIIEGSGRLADEVVTYWRAFRAKQQGQATPEDEALLAKLDDDPLMCEIIEEGKINTLPLNISPTDLESHIYDLLPTNPIDDKKPLYEAWHQFAFFDQAATRKAGQFRRMRQNILWVGLLAVVFGLLSTSVHSNGLHEFIVTYFPEVNVAWWTEFIEQGLHFIALLLPIFGSILFAGANRFHPGNDWVTLRSGAEDIKKEIFMFRTKVEPYTEQDRATKLADKIDRIGRKVLSSSVQEQEIKPYHGPVPPVYEFADNQDDGLSPLDGESYLKHRLENQITFFETKAAQLGRRIHIWRWIIYSIGGIGTGLGLLGLDAFIAITAAISTALASYLEIIQAESTLRGYNETAQLLRGIRGHWVGANVTPLGPTQQRAIFEKMVKTTEHALVTERSGWINQMNEALKEFMTETRIRDEDEVVPPKV